MSGDIDEMEDIDLVQLRVGNQGHAMAGVGVTSGLVFLNGDLHPLGAMQALKQAMLENVPYCPASAVAALFPSNWLRAQCMHDADRLRIIGNLEQLVKNHGGGARAPKH